MSNWSYCEKHGEYNTNYCDNCPGCLEEGWEKEKNDGEKNRLHN